MATWHEKRRVQKKIVSPSFLTADSMLFPLPLFFCPISRTIVGTEQTNGEVSVQGRRKVHDKERKSKKTCLMKNGDVGGKGGVSGLFSSWSDRVLHFSQSSVEKKRARWLQRTLFSLGTSLSLLRRLKRKRQGPLFWGKLFLFTCPFAVLPGDKRSYCRY